MRWASIGQGSLLLFLGISLTSFLVWLLFSGSMTIKVNEPPPVVTSQMTSDEDDRPYSLPKGAALCTLVSTPRLLTWNEIQSHKKYYRDFKQQNSKIGEGKYLMIKLSTKVKRQTFNTSSFFSVKGCKSSTSCLERLIGENSKRIISTYPCVVIAKEDRVVALHPKDVVFNNNYNPSNNNNNNNNNNTSNKNKNSNSNKNNKNNNNGDENIINKQVVVSLVKRQWTFSITRLLIFLLLCLCFCVPCCLLGGLFMFCVGVLDRMSSKMIYENMFSLVESQPVGLRTPKKGGGYSGGMGGANGPGMMNGRNMAGVTSASSNRPSGLSHLSQMLLNPKTA